MPPSISNASVNGTLPSKPRGSWADPRASVRSSRPKNYPHLKDILATSTPDVDRDAPLNIQLEKVEGYIQSSRRSLDFDRLDLAYKDYLKGFEIAVNYIPVNAQFDFYCNTKIGWESRYKTLVRTIRTMDGKMGELRWTIEKDNSKSGVQPQIEELPTTPRSSRLDMPSAPTNAPGQPATATAIPFSLDERPAVRPKPPDLSERFAALRSPTSDRSSPTSRPQSYSPRSSSSGSSIFKPQGPRAMPVGSARPTVPPKVPIDGQEAMPRLPSPTYSPTSALSTPTYSNPTRTPADSQASEKGARWYYNQPDSHLQPFDRPRGEDSPYRPKTPNGVNTAIIAKSNSSDIPHDRAIHAAVLVEYLRRYNVLVIDVRDRDLFDQGHLLATSIICIEPVSLKEGVSAEELEDRLVVSPEAEQTLFEKRNEFDLVVYMDQSTTSTSYLSGPPTGSSTPALRALYDTLYEFNEYKPLKDGRPPALLVGGLDAWVDLMGSHSLQSSKTAALMGSTKLRRGAAAAQSRPFSRRVPSINSSIEVRKRRMLKYQPLNPVEEQAWRRQAQEEEVVTPGYPPEDGREEQPQAWTTTAAPREDDDGRFVQDYDAYLRYPEIHGARQSMTMPTRQPPDPPSAPFSPPDLPPPPPPPPPQPPSHPPGSAPSSALAGRPAPNSAGRLDEVVSHHPTIPSRPPPAVPRPSYSGHAEIHTAQPPLARQTSSIRTPLYSSYPRWRPQKLPRTGLTNFGVTCYMNATLQCLSATMPLSTFFLENDQYKQHQQKQNWKGSNGIMPELYTNLMRSMWKQDAEIIKPTTFRNFCGRMNREWVIDRQQDAKEFFDFLVDSLHEDLNLNWARHPLRPLTTDEERQRERTPMAQASSYEWLRYQHRDSSFISSLFAGQHASRLRCTSCGSTSTTYEAFYSISVEIPSSGQPATLQDCLRSYCQEERLSGDEVWKCPTCRCEREATKQIILTRLPHVLVIHFKRFSASKTESARKIHTPIEFPLQGFSMDRFVIPRSGPPSSSSSSSSSSRINGHLPPEMNKDDPATTPPYSYDAYAVLRHLGATSDGGHYVTLARDPGRGCWRKFDDERTIDFDPERLKAMEEGGASRSKKGGGGMCNGEAYIVFYQRASAAWL